MFVSTALSKQIENAFCSSFKYAKNEKINQFQKIENV